MLPSKEIRDAFPFIQKILTSAFRADVIYFSYPYENIRKIDWGFREMVWENVDFTPDFASSISSSDKMQMFVIKSNLGFYNIIAFVSLGERPDFISVGPVRDKDFYHADSVRLQKNPSMRDVTQETLRRFYQMLPLANIADLTATFRCLLEEYLPEYRDVTPEYVQFSSQEHALVPDQDKIQDFSYEVAQRLQKLLGTFSEANSRDSLPTSVTKPTSAY